VADSFRSARDRANALEDALRGQSDADAQGILDEFDKYCKEVYQKYIQIGYRYLQTIKKFSNWEEVDFCCESSMKG